MLEVFCPSDSTDVRREKAVRNLIECGGKRKAELICATLDDGIPMNVRAFVAFALTVVVLLQDEIKAPPKRAEAEGA